MSTEEEKVNILPTFRRALSAISMLELSNVQADLTICLQAGTEKPSFRITVFGSHSDNVAFFFSPFESQETVDRRLLTAIDTIRTDDFQKIKKVSRDTIL